MTFMQIFIQLIISNLIILFQSARNEESLSTELQSLKDQVNLKRSSMNEHVSHLESLREEVGLPLHRLLVISSRWYGSWLRI